MKVAIARLGILSGDGVTRVIEGWARMLRDTGHTVTVVSQAGEGAVPLDVPGTRTLLTPPRALRRLRYPLLSETAETVKTLADEHTRGGIDVIHTHHSVLAAHVRRQLPRVPLIHTIHSPAVDEHYLTNWKYAHGVLSRLRYPLTRNLLGRYEREAIASATVVHTLSEYTRTLLTSRYPRESARAEWAVVPGTFDDRRFVPIADPATARNQLGIPPDQTILLTVRRLVGRNGLERILSAARSLNPQQRAITRFLIGGTGELGSRLAEQIERDGIGDVVRLLGFIPERDLAMYYRAADALLLPSRELECFGLPVVEAMGCGCQPLVMPHGGPAEVCEKFPRWIATANTDEAFDALIQRFLSRQKSEPSIDLAEWARSRYSEDAVRPRVSDLVARAALL